jgi:hypothetical protein
MGRASAARNPDYGSLRPNGRPSPTRNRLVETTAGAFSPHPKEPIGGEEAKLTRPLVWRCWKNLSTLSTFRALRVLRKDSHASDIWACDFFCVQTVHGGSTSQLHQSSLPSLANIHLTVTWPLALTEPVTPKWNHWKPKPTLRVESRKNLSLERRRNSNFRPSLSAKLCVPPGRRLISVRDLLSRHRDREMAVVRPSTSPRQWFHRCRPLVRQFAVEDYHPRGSSHRLCPPDNEKKSTDIGIAANTSACGNCRPLTTDMVTLPPNCVNISQSPSNAELF